MCRDRLENALWGLVISPLALAAIILRMAIYLPLSFRMAAYIFIATLVLLLAMSIFFLRALTAPLIPSMALKDYAMSWPTAGACLLAAAITTCIHRPDADDVIYLPKIVHYVAYPLSIMDGSIREIASNPVLIYPKSAAAYYPTAYEFAQAAFAYLVHVNLLTVYYVLAPMLVGAFGMLALIWNLRLLGCSRRSASYASILLVPIILLLGETHRSYGNITLARAFQSKYAFLFFGIPIFTGLSLTFFRRHDGLSWTCLLLAVIGLAGMTSTALVMLPMLGFVLFCSWLITEDKIRSWPKLGLPYAASLLPAVFFALDYRRFAASRIGFGSALNAGFPKTFGGQFELVNGDALWPLSLIVLCAALLACLWRARERLFLLVWFGLALAFYLNPFTGFWIMRHVTSENIYWRLFYLLPFPLIIGVACARELDRLPASVSKGRITCGLFVMLSAAVFFCPTSVLRKDNRSYLGAPGWTLDEEASNARKALLLAADGVVLAPIPMAQDMAIFSASHQQIVTRTDLMTEAFFGKPDELAMRSRVASFIGGQGGNFQDLVHIVRRDSPSTIILASSAASPNVLGLLGASNLRYAGDAGPWLVYTSPHLGEANRILSNSIRSLTP